MKRIDREDVIGLIGLAIIIAGVFWIYRPAGVIVLGAVVIAYALILGSKPKPAASPRQESD